MAKKPPKNPDDEDMSIQAAAWMELAWGPAWLSRDDALSQLGKLQHEWRLFDDDDDTDDADD